MTATKGNGLDATNIQPAKTYQNNWLDCPTSERQRKAFATAAAMLALRGYVVQPLPVGYLVTTKGLSQHLNDMEALQDFANAVGVNHA